MPSEYFEEFHVMTPGIGSISYSKELCNVYVIIPVQNLKGLNEVTTLASTKESVHT